MANPSHRDCEHVKVLQQSADFSWGSFGSRNYEWKTNFARWTVLAGFAVHWIVACGLILLTDHSALADGASQRATHPLSILEILITKKLVLSDGQRPDFRLGMPGIQLTPKGLVFIDGRGIALAWERDHPATPVNGSVEWSSDDGDTLLDYRSSRVEGSKLVIVDRHTRIFKVIPGLPSVTTAVVTTDTLTYEAIGDDRCKSTIERIEEHKGSEQSSERHGDAWRCEFR